MNTPSRITRRRALQSLTATAFASTLMNPLAVLGLSMVAASFAPAASIVITPGQRQLFLDDDAVEKIVTLKRTMHSPDKKGAVIRPDPSLGLNSSQIRTAPIWDPQAKIYRLWDCSTPAELHSRGIYTGGYYESKDGLHWTKPVVGQFEFRGSRENNFFSVVIEGRNFRADCAVLDPREINPARRFKGLSFCSGGTSTALQKGMVLFPVASDGTTWKLIEGEALSTSDEFNLSYDDAERQFITSYKVGGPNGRCVGIYTSKDFKQWKNFGLVFHADELDQKLGRTLMEQRFRDTTLQHPVFNDPKDYNVDVYNMSVFRYEGLYIGMPAMFHATGLDLARTNKDGFHIIQLTCSRDLKHWQRLGDRKPFIGPSPRGAGAYDLTQIIGPSFPIYKGNELWFYYTGTKYRGNGLPTDGDPDIGATCLATLRRDGFISLDAGDKEGWVQTKPFVLPEGKLHLNVDALGGKAVVQVCDEKGTVIPGLEASVPITANQPDVVITWLKSDLKNLAGKTVCLRVNLRNAKLYSFWVH